MPQLRNIDKMYYNYGFDKAGRQCHQCPHFRKSCWNKKSTRKVIGYDENGKEIETRESFLECGLIDKPFPENKIAGQMSIDDLQKGETENAET